MTDPTTHPRKAIWTYLSHHAQVLVLVAQDPDARLRDIAAAVGITERAVHRIISELEESGVLEHNRTGRRNHYTIHAEAKLRHPVVAHRTVGDLLRMAAGAPKLPPPTP